MTASKIAPGLNEVTILGIVTEMGCWSRNLFNMPKQFVFDLAVGEESGVQWIRCVIDDDGFGQDNCNPLAEIQPGDKIAVCGFLRTYTKRHKQYPDVKTPTTEVVAERWIRA